MPVKLNKDFLDAVERGIVVLQKEAPKIAAPVKKALKGADNRPDLGDTKVARYSPLESKVQTTENVDSAISNAGYLAETKAGLNALSKLGKAGAVGGKILSTAGKVAEPVQMALWTVDSARTMTDPKYRAETQKMIESVSEGTPEDTVFSPTAFTSALARPVSTVQGELDTISQLDTNQLNEQLKQERLDRQMQRLLGKAKSERETILGRRIKSQNDRDVPAVEIRKGAQPNPRKFFK
jgi:hypothetical protein